MGALRTEVPRLIGRSAYALFIRGPEIFEYARVIALLRSFGLTT